MPFRQFCVFLSTVMTKRTVKRWGLGMLAVLTLLSAATVGGSCYMLSLSLTPERERQDTAQCLRRLAEYHPEAMPWLDSIRSSGLLCDTFVVMPSGERHHAYIVRGDGCRVAVVVHGWRDCAIDFLHIARLYHQMGFNVLLPDLHAHGLSEGDAVGMGWNERHDVLHWLSVAARRFRSNDFIVHGVSMGAATAMNVAGEAMPKEVRSIRFVEDCGYTSVWDELSHELRREYGLPDFPLLYVASRICRLRHGWSFGEASPLRQLERSRQAVLFIHGDADDFVPSWMVQPLYDAKEGEKMLWMTRGTAHARSYDDYPREYDLHLRAWAGDAGAQLRLALAADRAEDYAKAAALYRMVAGQGLAEAQNNLGVLFKDGQGVEQDYAEAARWFTLAAEQGNVLAQSNLGWLYQSGNGVQRDYAVARKWYLLAACRGHAAAQNNLGTMYRDGKGVLENADSASYWFRQAAEQGMELAKRNLEKMEGQSR